MKVLVIGGCGFIGSHVVDRLRAYKLDVRVLDRRPEQFRAPVPGVEYILGDYSDSAQAFEATSGIDAVIHLASTTVPATANLDPAADIRGNLISTVRLLEVMRAAEVKKMVYLSSGGTVYGIPETERVPESHPLRPISSYGIVKVAIENYLHMEQRLHGLNPLILRASNPYGPRQGHTGIQGIIGTHLWRTARGETVEIWGDGSVVRDYIHVTDLAELCVQAVMSQGISGSFNAGSGTGASVLEIVDSISRTVQQSGGAPVTPIHTPGRTFDVPKIVLDITKAREALGWQPSIDLDQGIADSWAWIQSQM